MSPGASLATTNVDAQNVDAQKKEVVFAGKRLPSYRKRSPTWQGPSVPTPAGPGAFAKTCSVAVHDGSPASASPGDGAEGDVSVTGYCKQAAFIGEQIIRQPSGSGSPSQLGAAFKGRSCFRLVLVVRRCTSVSQRIQAPSLPFTLFFPSIYPSLIPQAVPDFFFLRF